MKPTSAIVVATSICGLCAAVLAQVKGKELADFSEAERVLYSCLPQGNSLPHPLSLGERNSGTHSGRPGVYLRAYGPVRSQNLTIEIVTYSSRAEAEKGARDRTGFSAARDPYVEMASANGPGDVAFTLSGHHIRNFLKQDPGAFQDVYLIFVRGQHLVKLRYHHRPSTGDLPPGKTWMNGDPVKEVWRLARMVDTRLRALDAQSKGGG